jgi:glycosyltransferase involved in cell wall biosynthesis
MLFCCLMCVHNGEKFLVDQIESILTQFDSDSILFIHDWNSSDSSAKICLSYEVMKSNVIYKKWNSSPGPCESFLKSLSYIRDNYIFDYIFLSDQDDIWHPDRISIYRKLLNEDYSLICSNASVFKVNHLSDTKCVNPSLFFNMENGSVIDHSIFFANPIIGMTMCVSKDILFHIKDVDFKRIIMHDWFLSCLAVHYGVVYYTHQSTVFYRQHGNNHLGVTGKRLLIKFLFLPIHAKKLLEQQAYLSDFLGVRNPSFLFKIKILFCSSFLTLIGKFCIILLLILSQLKIFR